MISSPQTSRGRGSVTRGSPHKVSAITVHPSTSQMQNSVVQQTSNATTFGHGAQGQLPLQSSSGSDSNDTNSSTIHGLEPQNEVNITMHLCYNKFKILEEKNYSHLFHISPSKSHM